MATFADPRLARPRKTVRNAPDTSTIRTSETLANPLAFPRAFPPAVSPACPPPLPVRLDRPAPPATGERDRPDAAPCRVFAALQARFG